MIGCFSSDCHVFSADEWAWTSFLFSRQILLPGDLLPLNVIPTLIQLKPRIIYVGNLTAYAMFLEFIPCAF